MIHPTTKLIDAAKMSAALSEKAREYEKRAREQVTDNPFTSIYFSAVQTALNEVIIAVEKAVVVLPAKD